MYAPLDKKKQSRLIKSVILNGMFVVILSAFLWLYVYDGYSAVGAKVDTLNDMVKSFNAMKSDGIDGRKYQTLISKLNNNNRPKDEKVDYDKITEVLKKPANVSMPYMDWIKSEMTMVSAYDKIIENNARIIGNILPTFSDSPADQDDTFSKNRITLKSLVKFVEEHLLKKFNLESYSSVGLSNIVFSTSQVGVVNIGSYKVTLDIAGTNNSILALLDAIQASGTLPLKDGKLVDTDVSTNSGTVATPAADTSTDSALSNLLITVDAAKFDTPPERNDNKNKGQLVLVLYVRGRSYSDFIQIRNELAANIKTLKKNIETNGGLCKDGNSDICKNPIAFAAVNSIKSLQDDIGSIDQKMQESLKSNTIRDIGTEFDTLYGVLTSYNAINANYQKDLTDITNARQGGSSDTQTPATNSSTAQ